MGVDFSKRAISFYNKNGYVFFNKFEALNTRMKTVYLEMTKEEPKTTIRISDNRNKELGSFDININKDKRTIEGGLLVSHYPREGNGELLALTAIMELAKNKLNHLTCFSREENVPFLTRLGFLIDTDDSRYIRRGLKRIMKTKLPGMEDIISKAKFWEPQLKALGDTIPEDKSVFQFSCKVISDYMKIIARCRYPKKNYPFFGVGANTEFTDFQLLTEKTFLNHLTEKHCLDYKF